MCPYGLKPPTVSHYYLDSIIINKEETERDLILIIRGSYITWLCYYKFTDKVYRMLGLLYHRLAPFHNVSVKLNPYTALMCSQLYKYIYIYIYIMVIILLYIMAILYGNLCLYGNLIWQLYIQYGNLGNLVFIERHCNYVLNEYNVMSIN